MKKNLLLTLLLTLSVMTFGQKLPFQGKLIENGTPAEGTRTFVFEIAAAEWSETHTDVPITDGLYFVVLGSTNPLPDSLFYGVDEQSLSITVDGTALSPVVLFKPLSSPFEGSELVVKNDEGNIVGSLVAKTDLLKHGELEITGEGTGLIKGSFYKANDETVTDMPFISLNKNDAVLSYHATRNSNGENFGRFYLGAENGDYLNMYPNYIYGYHNGRGLYQLGHANWSGAENFGLLMLDGPNSGNFELTGQHWGNPDLPFFKMKGTANQDAVILSAEDNAEESGNIRLNTKRDVNQIYNELNANSTGLKIWKKQNWGVLHESVSLISEDRDGFGDAGYLNLSGPNSSNISFGTRHWEGTPDLPQISLFGENDFHGMELSITRDGENNQFGWINLMSENGKSLYLSPDAGIGVEGVSLSTSVNDFGTFGSIWMHGPNSDNIQMMPSWWENPDLGRMLILGTSPTAAIDLGAFPENGFEVGQIGLSSTDGSSAHWSPQHLDLHNGFRTVSIASISSNNGTFGSLILDGPNSRNITLMPEWWDKPDMGFFEVSGTNQGRVNIEVNDDGNGQYGLMHLYSDYQKSIRMDPTSIALRDDANGFNPLVLIDVNNDSGNGWAGNINLNGPNSNNIQIQSKSWENADLPWLSLNGERTNLMHLTGIGGSNEFGYIHLMSEDGSTSNLSAYRVENNNGNGMTGYFGSDRVTFNDNGHEMTYNAWGISGSSALEIQNGANITGILTINGDTIGYGFSSSDRRFKKNIKPIDGDILLKMQELEGVSYNWKQDEFPQKHFSSDKQIGLIAQELEAQFPALVKTDKEGFKSVNYNGFAAVLLEAVKELNAKVEKLEAENSQLKAELSASAANASEIEHLKAQVDALFHMVQGQQTPVTTEKVYSSPGLK